jgi:hypothetical protein
MNEGGPRWSRVSMYQIALEIVDQLEAGLDVGGSTTLAGR